MKLTPLDIRKHEFARRVRGYDPEEVRPFLEMLSRQWDELNEELRHAQERVRDLEMKIVHYEKVEEALQQALESAREGAQRTLSHAEQRARLLVEEAELRAEQIVQQAEQERFRLRQDVSKLTHRHAEITARLRHFLLSELEVLAQHEEERPIGFMKLIPAREAEALPPAAREPAAVPPEPTAAPGAEEPPEDQEPAPTTYADLYARAARRGPAPAEPPRPIDDAEPDEEPAWTLRSLVADEEVRQGPDAGEARTFERDQLRRIIDDLD